MLNNVKEYIKGSIGTIKEDLLKRNSAKFRGLDLAEEQRPTRVWLARNNKAAAEVDYPAYGVTGPNREVSPSGDRRLAQSAQMYHYQHQKQQILAMENRAGGGRRGSMSEAESEDENEEGDYTVYECPGLAPTGEMEVKNPLFQDDPTPATPSNAAAGEAKP